MRAVNHYRISPPGRDQAVRGLRVAAWVLLSLWGCSPAPSVPASDSALNPFRYFTRPVSTPVQATPHPAIVRVVVDEGNALSQGSGSFVAARDQHALIVTNWHVVRDVKGKVEVVFPDGFRSAATILTTDSDWDLAALLCWRPACEPLRVSLQAPQPGDMLTIAGYGQGDYRAVSGKCTQYVSPSTKHPYEMVELAAQARQGDSGGPILNERGELAGVLFGASRGSTSGSYCGRVRAFLTTVWPDLDAPLSPNPPLRGTPSDTPPAVTPSPPPMQENSGAAVTSPPSFERPRVGTPLVGFTPSPPAYDTSSSEISEPPATDLAPLSRWPQDEIRSGSGVTYSPDSSLPSAPPAIVYTPPPSPHAASTTGSTWERLAGHTPYDQAKTVLAIIGLLTVWAQICRLLGK